MYIVATELRECPGCRESLLDEAAVEVFSPVDTLGRASSFDGRGVLANVDRRDVRVECGFCGYDLTPSLKKRKART